MTRKSDAFPIFREFQSQVERQFNSKIKNVQSDWDGEYRSLNTFFKSCGINHRITCPHTHEQNGTVERRNCHVVETGLSLLAQASLPSKFWHFAFDTAVYLINRMPTQVPKNDSPYHLLFKTAANYLFLKVFGCLCFPYLRPYNTHKMSYHLSPYIRSIDVSTLKLIVYTLLVTYALGPCSSTQLTSLCSYPFYPHSGASMSK